MNQKQGDQQVKGDGSPTQSYVNTPGVLHSAPSPQGKKDLVSEFRGESQRCSEGWTTSAVQTGWESCGCSAWRGEDSKDTL